MHLFLEQHSSLFTNPPPMYLLEIPWFYHKLHALSICTFIYPPNKIKPLFFNTSTPSQRKFFFRGIYLCRDFILLTCSKIWCTALFRFLYLWRSTSQRRLIPFNMTVLFVYKFIQFLKQKENMPIFSEIVALLMNSSYRENLQNVSVYTFLFKCLGERLSVLQLGIL